MMEAKVNHDTQFYRIKGAVGVQTSLPLTTSPLTFETVDEILEILLPACTKFSYLTQGFSKIDAKA